jgi:hypothetical protein
MLQPPKHTAAKSVKYVSLGRSILVQKVLGRTSIQRFFVQGLLPPGASRHPIPNVVHILKCGCLNCQQQHSASATQQKLEFAASFSKACIRVAIFTTFRRLHDKAARVDYGRRASLLKYPVFIVLFKRSSWKRSPNYQAGHSAPICASRRFAAWGNRTGNCRVRPEASRGCPCTRRGSPPRGRR